MVARPQSIFEVIRQHQPEKEGTRRRGGRISSSRMLSRPRLSRDGESVGALMTVQTAHGIEAGLTDVMAEVLSHHHHHQEEETASSDSVHQTQMCNKLHVNEIRRSAVASFFQNSRDRQLTNVTAVAALYDELALVSKENEKRFLKEREEMKRLKDAQKKARTMKALEDIKMALISSSGEFIPMTGVVYACMYVCF